ncbi:hemerythrin domain-containing protein [Flavobacterium ardleyense]|uniref:Hemerythrin domain-containing protein n=1 Tax=Flavobacterium ardleyense TaxID=2038737 RepID=A0ABW5Z5P8_9FLAO
MEVKKPLKRNPAIVTFSKDHHFALLLVWKIREGLKKEIETSRISNYIIHFFDTDLIFHFEEEETLLFSKLPSDNLLRLQAEEEHKLIKLEIDALRNNPEDKVGIENLANILEKHIRFEERELFNYLQEIFTEDELAAVAEAMEARTRDHEIIWKDEFWIVTK